MALVKCPRAFRQRRLAAQNGCRGISVRHLSCKFPHKMVFVKCPCAFRLCRLAQNDVPGGVRGHFSCKFQHKMARSCTEILPRDLLQRSCQEVTYINLAKKTLLESLYRRKGSCTETLHRVEILHRHLLGSCQDAPCRDLAKRTTPLIELLCSDLVRTPLLETLYGDIAWRAVAEILPKGFYRELVRRSRKEILPRDLV